MNMLFFAIGTILYPLCTPTKPDTIILNAGNNSKIIFYGKSAADLQQLETIDLNKILKELNTAQAGAQKSDKQYINLDNQEFISEPIEPTRGQRYLANTFLNLHIGVGYNVNRYTFFQAPPALLNHPTGRLTNDIVMENLMTSSLSVVHDMKFATRPGYDISLRYGAGIGLNIQRFLHWNLVWPVPNEDIKQVTERAKELLKENQITPLKSDFNAFQSFIQVTPRVVLKNRKGLSTFYLNVGARLNYNRNFQNANPSQYANAVIASISSGPTASDEKSPITTGGGYGVYGKKHTFGISYLAEMGYKWIGLFIVYYPEYIPLTTKPINGTDRLNSGFINGKKGSIGYVSFGVKLGR
ncbi:hypothetical protein MUK70_27840 [Dyadobacter chenwenxiniae]|uniref:Outer membrane protein beta-barrel domain-containing protein n=1 Tax=Dyadobacter chenwenxiniae TaxID=2906456 RepID=A0A9X1PQ48_9BACT|nr:hypothetical protein [Dyadobacter chenwenxiniae]MCF0064094.1 hypothetical protein [Dyadobacter chenwenxiniae]UON82822.1 hypothetical protein MUK70_27840 [Dyadobacter chenwenxiniae]